MTVTYSLDVSSSSFFCLHRLLFRWKLVVWLAAYYFLSGIYRFGLTKQQRETFEDLCIFFDTYSGFIPITFMLGFYVSTVFDRWVKIFDNIGWIDAPALMIAQHVEGTTEKARRIRRNVLRYMVLTQALVFRDVSACVRKRFPTMKHLVTAGLMTEKELIHFDTIVSPHPKYWQPMHWIFSLLKAANNEGMISSDIVYTDLLEKIRVFRINVLNLTLFDWVPVPLVYTQVVHLAVRSFFVIALFGRQYLNPTRNLSEAGFKKTIDIYVPIMSILQFIFFVGWMKVAEVLLNPLGEDDDDFETNYILDRNLQVGFSMVDDAYSRCPELERDIFWEDKLAEPYYTVETAARPCNPQVGSCSNLTSNNEDDNYMLRCRRRTISRNSRYGVEVDDCDIVPVNGMQKERNSSQYASGESLAFSQSFMNQSRKLSEMFRRMRGGRKSVAEVGRQRTLRRSISKEDNLEHAPSRCTSVDSMDRFGASFHINGLSPTSVSLPPNGLQSSSTGGLTVKTELETDSGVGQASQSPAQWPTDEMLPVIEEEDPEKKRYSTDAESLQSSTSRSFKHSPGDPPKLPTSLEEDSSADEDFDTTRTKYSKNGRRRQKNEESST